MKFKGIYRQEDSDISLGRFYNTDIRKLIALKQYYPLMFHDGIGDPYAYYTERVRADDSIFLSIKRRKEVAGYGAIDPLSNHVVIAHFWMKKLFRATKDEVARAMRLLLQFAFKEFEANKVAMIVPVSLKANINMTERAGFTQEGRLRKAFLYNSVPSDVYVYGMLKEEF